MKYPSHSRHNPVILGPGGDVLKLSPQAQVQQVKPIVYLTEFFALEKPVEPTQDHPELKGEERLFCNMRDMTDPDNPVELNFKSDPLTPKDQAAFLPALSREAQVKKFFADMAEVLYKRSQAHKL